MIGKILIGNVENTVMREPRDVIDDVIKIEKGMPRWL